MKTTVTAMLGGLLLLAGTALLALPGPGFVVIAAGLGVLASRFRWARKPLEYAKDKAQQGVEQVGRNNWQAAGASLCGLGLVILGILSLAGVDVPLVTTVSAVLLIGSGTLLIGTIIWARNHPRAPGEPSAKTR